MQINLSIIILALVMISTSTVKAQVQPIEVDRNLLEEDSKAYCTTIQGQTVYEGAVLTVPIGHDCSSWLNYLSQRETTEKNLKLQREQHETNSKLQLYLNTTPRW